MGLNCDFDAYSVIDAKVNEAIKGVSGRPIGYSITLPSNGMSGHIDFYKLSFDGSPMGQTVSYRFDRDQVIPTHDPKNPNVLTGICFRDPARHFEPEYFSRWGVSDVADVVRAVSMKLEPQYSASEGVPNF